MPHERTMAWHDWWLHQSPLPLRRMPCGLGEAMPKTSTTESRNRYLRGMFNPSVEFSAM